MRANREVIRTIFTDRFKVEVFVQPEDMDPADSVAFGEDEESQEAERAYLERIYNGSLPWVWIGAEVSLEGTCESLGFASLGGCDFLPFEGEYGCQVARDLIREAISEARKNAGALIVDMNRSARALASLKAPS